MRADTASITTRKARTQFRSDDRDCASDGRDCAVEKNIEIRLGIKKLSEKKRRKNNEKKHHLKKRKKNEKEEFFYVFMIFQKLAKLKIGNFGGLRASGGGARTSQKKTLGCLSYKNLRKGANLVMILVMFLVINQMIIN